MRQEEARRILKMKWLSGSVISKEKLRPLTKLAGCKLVRSASGADYFSVAGDKAAAGLVKAAVKKGLPLVEAAFEAHELEELFMGDQP
jgi:hypothetical protein